MLGTRSAQVDELNGLFRTIIFTPPDIAHNHNGQHNYLQVRCNYIVCDSSNGMHPNSSPQHYTLIESHQRSATGLPTLGTLAAALLYVFCALYHLLARLTLHNDHPRREDAPTPSLHATSLRLRAILPTTAICKSSGETGVWISSSPPPTAHRLCDVHTDHLH